MTNCLVGRRRLKLQQRKRACITSLQLSSLPSIPEFINIPSTSCSSYTGLQVMPPQSQQVPESQIACANTAIPNDAIPPVSIDSNYLGPYGFKAMFHPPENMTKSTAWTYSEMLDKLFVTMGTNCPIDFQMSVLPPVGSTITVRSVFINVGHSLQIVKRCLTHETSNEPHDINHTAPDHVIRCESHRASYNTDERTGQKLLNLELSESEAGPNFLTTCIFKFMCWTSCVGGMNRRRIRVIFSLDYQGFCLGRHVVEVRVCACPGRDRKSEEKRFLKTTSQVSLVSSKPEQGLALDLKRGISIVKGTLNIHGGPASKKRKLNENGTYVLRLNSREEYQTLKALRNALRALKAKNGKETSEEE